MLYDCYTIKNRGIIFVGFYDIILFIFMAFYGYYGILFLTVMVPYIFSVISFPLGCFSCLSSSPFRHLFIVFFSYIIILYFDVGRRNATHFVVCVWLLVVDNLMIGFGCYFVFC